MTNRQRHLLVLLIYGLLAIIMTWPLVTQLGTHLPGEVEVADTYVHYWMFNWIKTAVLTQQNPLQTTLLFHPNNISLLDHNLAWVNMALWLPLQTIFGEATAYSLAFIGIFIFNGYTTYLLATELLRSPAPQPLCSPAFLAGLIAAFWPYNLSHPDHPNLILIGWLPLVILYLHRLFVAPNRQNALLAGLFIALLGITRWQLLLMATPLIVLFILIQFRLGRPPQPLPAEGEGDSPRFLKYLLLTGFISIVLMAPFLAPFVSYQLNRSDPTDLLVAEEAYGTDLLAFVLPGRYHPWWGEAVISQYNQFQGNKLYTRSIGYTVLLLLLHSLATLWRKSRFWLLMLLLYGLLALGSNLTVMGKTLFPLPYSLVDEWFLLRLLRFPDRFNVILALPVAILAGTAVQKLLTQRSQWLAGLIALMILIEYAVTLPTLPLNTPTWYSQLAQEPGDFAILQLPTHTRLQYNKHYMAYQLVHGKALVEGRIARPSSTAYAFMDSVPLLQHSLNSNKPPLELMNVGHQLTLLAAADVRYVILHKQFLSNGELTTWRDWLFLPPFYEDEEVLVMQTAVSLPPFSHEFIPQLGLLAVNQPPEQAKAGDWLHFQAHWGSQTAVSQAIDVCFNLVATETIFLGCQPLSPTWPSHQWQTNELVRAEYAVQLSPFVAGGPYALQMGLAGEETAVDLGPVTIAPLPRNFRPASPQQAADVTWHNLLLLTGYDVQTTSHALTLTLHWQARERPSTSYKLFVHVAEATTGNIITQADLIPGNWTYPTNWWETGEYVCETLTFPDLPSGEYEIWLGWYEPESGQRLVTTEGEDRVWLTAVTLPNQPD